MAVTTIARLYLEWTALRQVSDPMLQDPNVEEARVGPLLERIWALEHQIAAAVPVCLEDVRFKAIVVKRWMEDAATERIIEELLDSLMGWPAASQGVTNA